MCPNTNYIVYSFRICGLLLWRKQIHKLICLQHKRACRLNSLPLHFRPYAYRTKELKFHYFRTGYLTAVEKPTGNWYEPLCVSQNPDRSQAIHVSTRQWAKIKERERVRKRNKKRVMTKDACGCTGLFCQRFVEILASMENTIYLADLCPLIQTIYVLPLRIVSLEPEGTATLLL